MKSEVRKHIYYIQTLSIYNKKYYVYVILTVNNKLYCGYTDNVEKRVTAHNLGKGAKYTKARRPVVLVHSEGYFTKSAAMQRECEIKKMSRKEKLSLVGEADI